MAKRTKPRTAPKPRVREQEATLLRSAEALGRMIGALQRQIANVSERLSGTNGSRGGVSAQPVKNASRASVSASPSSGVKTAKGKHTKRRVSSLKQPKRTGSRKEARPR
jgi:hypothetical protein